MQKRNNYIEIEDFLADESFQLWILSKVDEQGWEEWTLENLQRAKLVEDARLVLLAMRVPESKLSSNEVHEALQETWRKIEHREELSQQSSKIKKLKIRRYWISGVAAAILIGIFSTWFFRSEITANDNVVTYNELVQDNNEGLVEQTNNSEKSQIITLSDGSSVLLQPNSKLSYPKIFTGTKERCIYPAKVSLKLVKILKSLFLFMLMRLSLELLEQALE
ncbi:hypothetical protein [Flavobacterium ginsengisoli]|uniref:hypothetical protein n=1 Tax=Flavobacterium ginsengisoli TaxID=871694 RepID=UPI00241567C4|nr:hypothetical protein [Flavobacterium ginsengisoli]